MIENTKLKMKEVKSQTYELGNSVIDNESHLAKMAARNHKSGCQDHKVAVRSASRSGMQATASPLAKVAARIIMWLTE